MFCLHLQGFVFSPVKCFHENCSGDLLKNRKKRYSRLILGFGVEILGTKLILRKVVRESLLIAHVEVPKNPLPGFPFIGKIQGGRHEIQLF